jgi:hypothetical protein
MLALGHRGEAMNLHRIVPAIAFALGASCAALPSYAQGLNAGNCIVAGRISDKDRWAPRFEGMDLLAARGRVVTAADKPALSDVQQIRIRKPALLSRCDGDGDLARLDDQASIPKEPVPALAPGLVEVEAVSFPRLRTGGELVEFRVKLPLDRVVMVKR